MPLAALTKSIARKRAPTGRLAGSTQSSEGRLVLMSAGQPYRAIFGIADLRRCRGPFMRDAPALMPQQNAFRTLAIC
jgi:hypothetical protein